MESGGFGSSIFWAFSGETKILLLNKNIYLCRNPFVKLSNYLSLSVAKTSRTVDTKIWENRFQVEKYQIYLLSKLYSLMEEPVMLFWG